jgi:lia operon protein LiaG
MGIKTTIFVLLTIMVVCLGIGVSLIFFTDDYYAGPKNNRIVEINQLKTYDVYSINNIDIKAISSEINLIPTSTDTIKIHFHGSSSKKDQPELFTNKVGDKLLIEIDHPILFFDFYTFKDTTLDIEIPTRYKDQIKIDSVSGDINFQRFDFEKIDIDAISGDITGTYFTSGKINLESVSGEIFLDQFIGGLTANSISGDVILNYQELNEDQNIESVSGNIKLNFPRDSNFYLNFDTISGNVNNEFPITTQGSNDYGLQGKVGSGIHDVDVGTISGDLKIFD